MSRHNHLRLFLLCFPLRPFVDEPPHPLTLLMNVVELSTTRQPGSESLSVIASRGESGLSGNTGPIGLSAFTPAGISVSAPAGRSAFAPTGLSGVNNENPHAFDILSSGGGSVPRVTT